MTPTIAELLLACEALAAIVREEYPSRYSLAEIVSVWGDANPDQQQAVKVLETYWGHGK